MRTFADQAAIAIANVELFETVERPGGELSRFLSPQVRRSSRAPRREDARKAPPPDHCGLLRLRGFTAFAETAEPEEVLGVLRDYHRLMGELIVQPGTSSILPETG